MSEPVRSVHSRVLATAFGLCACAMIALLANHPHGGAQTFAEVLRIEAREQTAAAVVHGGFIATLAVLTACLSFLCRDLGAHRVAVTSGFIAFCIGTGVMIASLLIDGLVIPAIAVRYVDVATPEALASARTIFVLCGTLIGFLMPMALAFQGLAMIGISYALLGPAIMARVAGFYGMAAGGILCVMVFAAPPAMREHVVLIGIVFEALWYLALAAAVFGAKGPQPQPRPEV